MGLRALDDRDEFVRNVHDVWQLYRPKGAIFAIEVSTESMSVPGSASN